MAHVKMNTPFGFSSIEVGTVTVFTVKMIFTSLYGYALPDGVIQFRTRKGKVMITYSCADFTAAQDVFARLGAIMKDIAVRKLADKYQWVPEHMAAQAAADRSVAEHEFASMIDDLPF